MRPPCCNIDGIKKGPWTPEEDIVLIAYIQEHGPGNWSAVPATTGLSRCSKSCRLRWTNYLRPGIKRGNFTPREQGMIIHLQALLGNKWAAIASYLPQRTDNDIKNYWNTHLKKQQQQQQQQINKFQSATDSPQNTKSIVVESSSPYALSAENISRLLQNWINSSSSSSNTMTTTSLLDTYGSRFLGETGKIPDELCDSCSPQQSVHGQELEKIMLFDRGFVDSVASSCDSSGLVDHEKVCIVHDEKPPLSFLENWLHDENGATQVEGEMEIPPLFWPAKESNVMIEEPI